MWNFYDRADLRHFSCNKKLISDSQLKHKSFLYDPHEFLIKKKEPLTQPPDFETIPEPGSMESKAEKQESSIEQILKTIPSKENQTTTQSSSTEESILNQIKKWKKI